jgi:hypothetical protein
VILIAFFFLFEHPGSNPALLKTRQVLDKDFALQVIHFMLDTNR